MRSSTTIYLFFFQAEDGIRDWSVTGVQTCALPICHARHTQECRCLLQAARICDDEVGLCDKPEHLEVARSEEHTSELQSLTNLVCRLLLEKKKKKKKK